MKYQFSQQIKSNKIYHPIQRRNYAVVYLAFTEKLNRTKSNTHLFNCNANKENSNLQNCIESPRISLKSQRNTVGSTPRQSLPS